MSTTESLPEAPPEPSAPGSQARATRAKATSAPVPPGPDLLRRIIERWADGPGEAGATASPAWWTPS